jgi:hypothetical protein
MAKRDPYLLERDLERYRKRYSHVFPILENTPDLHRGETRLAAEVAMHIIKGSNISQDQARAFEAARMRMFETLNTLAKG